MKGLMKVRKSLLISLILVVLLSQCFTAFAATAPIYEVEYLSNVYQIEISEDITKGEFEQHLSMALNDDQFLVTEEPLASEKITTLEALSLAIKASNMEELARTYSKEKINRALKKVNLSFDENNSKISKAEAQDLALALDIELLPASLVPDFATENLLSQKEAALILTRTLDLNGCYKNYLGTVMEPTIYGKVLRAIENAKKVNDEELLTALDSAIELGLTTGYNIRDTRNNSNFDPVLTIRYGHDNPIHAIQLIGLLRSEGVNAKVNIETKTSSYKHMAEWGTDPNPNYEFVPTADGNYYAHVKEYDILFEFPTVELKNKFQDIVYQYAIKKEADQPGLIYQAWWQPVFTSNVELGQYLTMTDNIVKNEVYEAHVYTLNEDSQALVDALKELDPSLEISTEIVWVNVQFYNYLKGEAR
ncbi:MAG: hypothetical protein ACOX1Y_09255 [Zhaonellaceae bacterium]|jgi:hypothetical protein|nr:hypothetical protein [Clostridia bacterium]